MNSRQSLLVCILACLFLPAFASAQVAVLAEATAAAPTVEKTEAVAGDVLLKREKEEALAHNPALRGKGRQNGEPLLVVVDDRVDVTPLALSAEEYVTAKEVFDEPPANVDDVVLLPEFIVSGDETTAARRLMIERLSADIARMEAAGFDPIMGGKVAVASFGDARLMFGNENDAEEPGFSIVSLEW